MTATEAMLKYLKITCSCLTDTKELADSLITETAQKKRACELSRGFQLWGFLALVNSFH